MNFTVRTPNRVDFVGGSTDIYPLYLLMGGGCTLNAAVTVYSAATFVTTGARGVRVISEDLGVSIHSDCPDLLSTVGPLGMLARAVQVLQPPVPVEIRTRNEAPAGSGLGASSALLVAFLHGLALLGGETLGSEALVNLAADIETAAIGVPAGKQDYLASVFGGVSLLAFGCGGFSRSKDTRYTETAGALNDRLIVSYTGESRFSGANNWDIVKSYIDDAPGVRSALRGIRDLAVEAGVALREGRVDDFSDAVNREWMLRRSLAPGISTPMTDRLIARARDAGALASKICGAGGGGCLATLAPPERKRDVARALSEEGAAILDCVIAEEGLIVEGL